MAPQHRQDTDSATGSAFWMQTQKVYHADGSKHSFKMKAVLKAVAMIYRAVDFVAVKLPRFNELEHRQF